METLEASQQATRWEPYDLSGVSLDSSAFQKNCKTVIYDVSGAVQKTLETVILCEACEKTFASKQSLERHKERFPLCKSWVQDAKSEPFLTESVYIWAQGKIDEALTEKDCCKKCKFCKVEFATLGNFHKHFKSSTVCNRLGMREIKRVFNQNE